MILVSDWNSLLTLCQKASLGELHALVDELHFARRNGEAPPEDYSEQNRLKTLIYLIYLCGGATYQDKLDYNLLRSLKVAGAQLKMRKPRGILRSVLQTLTFNWPELLTMFGALLAKPAVQQLLGSRIDQVLEYLQFYRLLYFAVLKRLIKSNSQVNFRRYVLSKKELANSLGTGLILPEHIRAYKIPLLPLYDELILASPELLYDSLLENYIDLLSNTENLEL